MLLMPFRFAIAAALMLELAGCATAPAGPRIPVYPGSGKDDFRADDMTCRQYASDQTGGVNAAQASNTSAVATGIVGTLSGAAAGGAIGGRQGVAVALTPVYWWAARRVQTPHGIPAIAHNRVMTSAISNAGIRRETVSRA